MQLPLKCAGWPWYGLSMRYVAMLLVIFALGSTVGCDKIRTPRRERQLAGELNCGVTVRGDDTYLLTFLTTKVDLSRLKDLPVTGLELYNTREADLSQLEGMKLLSLVFPPKHLTQGIGAVRNMESLKTINRFPASEFWRKYDLREFDDICVTQPTNAPAAP